MVLTLALDIGGTKIAAGLVDADGTLVHHAKLPTPDGDAEAIWAVVDTLVTEALAAAGGRVRGVALRETPSPGLAVFLGRCRDLWQRATVQGRRSDRVSDGPEGSPVTRWPRAGQSGGKTAAPATGAACRVSVADLWCLRGVWPGVRRAGLPEAEPGADAGPRCHAAAPPC